MEQNEALFAIITYILSFCLENKTSVRDNGKNVKRSDILLQYD